MSTESERAAAIESGIDTFLGAWGGGTDNGIAALLDAGWAPPAQRDEELRQMAAWQRDARRAFDSVETLCKNEIDYYNPGSTAPTVKLAEQVLAALGERFTTPGAAS